MARSLELQGGKIIFPKPLLQAQIIGRASRFIVLADLQGKTIDCHCPVTGNIGGLQIDGLPCLVSGPYDLKARSTGHTLEAFAMVHPDDPDFEWIGVNQGMANAYVEAAFKAGWLDPIVVPATVEREKKLGSSRIDFLINGSTFLEVKMPVDNLQKDPPPALPRKWPMASKGLGRADRQALDLTAHLGTGQRSVFLRVFCYDNDGRWREWPYRQAKAAKEGIERPGAQIFADARAAGLETWELSLKLYPTHLEFLRLNKVS